MDTLQWIKELYLGKCVSIGLLAAVIGLRTSEFETVLAFMCMSCPNHPAVVCGSVATGDQVKLFKYVNVLSKAKHIF